MIQEKSCPFCGSTEIYPDFRDRLQITFDYRVKDATGIAFWECKNCYSRGPVSVQVKDDKISQTEHVRLAKKCWNKRETLIPIIGQQEKFLGFLLPRAISRPPEYDGEAFYIIPPVDLPASINELANDTVECIQAVWKCSRVRVQGRQYKGWSVHVEVNENLLWEFESDYFVSWVEYLGTREE